MKEQSLKGRTAIVTGGGAGIGRASALELAWRGASVAVLDIDGSAADETAALLRETGVESLALATDVSDGVAVAQAVDEVRAKLGAALVLFSNAGIGNKPMLFQDDTYEHWRRQFAVHVDGAFHTVQNCLPGMIEARWGRIVVTSSIAATMGIKGVVSYAAAKGALLGFIHSLALECASKGITVNAVAPGYIDTAMLQEVGGEAIEYVESTIPMKHQGQPEDIAAAVGYLCSEQGRYMSGQVLSPNGAIWFAG